MVAAPAGRARPRATAARVLGDWTDVVVVPSVPAGRGSTARVVTFAAAWGALALAALLLDERAGR